MKKDEPRAGAGAAPTRAADSDWGIAMGAAVGLAAGLYAGHPFLYTAAGIVLGLLADLLFGRAVQR